MAKRVKFWYTNHRGEVSEREVDVECVEYLPNPGYGYTAGWFLAGHDCVKDARRSFKFDNIVLKPGEYLRLEL